MKPDSIIEKMNPNESDLKAINSQQIYPELLTSQPLHSRGTMLQRKILRHLQAGTGLWPNGELWSATCPSLSGRVTALDLWHQDCLQSVILNGAVLFGFSVLNAAVL